MKSLKIGGAVVAAFALILGGALPAYAGQASGSHTCSSTQRVFVRSTTTPVSSAVTTQHDHVYASAHHYTNFSGSGTHTSYSGTSSTSIWTVVTTPTNYAVSATDGCAAKGV